jgi:hypothetical protein
MRTRHRISGYHKRPVTAWSAKTDGSGSMQPSVSGSVTHSSAFLSGEIISLLLRNLPLVHREGFEDNIKIEDSCLRCCDILHCIVFHVEPVTAEKHDTSIFKIEITSTLMMETRYYPSTTLHAVTIQKSSI